MSRSQGHIAAGGGGGLSQLEITMTQTGIESETFQVRQPPPTAPPCAPMTRLIAWYNFRAFETYILIKLSYLYRVHPKCLPFTQNAPTKHN
jgi:hypothetical protein